MMENLKQIRVAIAHGNAIRSIYADLRTASSIHDRTSLLRRAEAYAETLGQTLGEVAAAQKDSEHSDMETLNALRELGDMMEQLMVQEREYRISAGGADAACANPAEREYAQ